MTLNLSATEMRTLDELTAQKDLLKIAVIPRGQQVYQVLAARTEAEPMLFLEGDKTTKAEVVVL